jgi:preprotein translocase subunit SecA
VVGSAVAENANPDLPPEEWDWEQLLARIREVYPTTLELSDFDPEATALEEVQERFLSDALGFYAHREQELGPEQIREIERLVLLSVIDNRWREHLYEMDYLQEGIGLRAMAQRDPLVEYQREGYEMFLQMQETIKEDFARYMFHVEAVREDEGRRQPARMRQERRQIPMAQFAATPAGVDVDGRGHPPDDSEGVLVEPARSDKIPRNAPCPCGSGRKYKQCHGRPGAVGL